MTLATQSVIHGIRRYWRFVLGLILSAVFLVLAVQQVEWDRTLGALAAANLPLIGVGTGLLLVAYALFAVRWRVLLSSAAHLPVGDLFSYIMIGYLANNTLPFRLGDVARAALLGKKYSISTSLVLGSVVLERALDILTVLLLAFVLAWVVDVPPLVQAGMATFAGVALALLVGLLLLAYYESRLSGLTARLPAFVPRAVSARLVDIVARFASGLRTLRNGRQLARASALSALAWLIAGASTICWLAAFHLPTPWYAGLFVLAVINLGGAFLHPPGRSESITIWLCWHCLFG